MPIITELKEQSSSSLSNTTLSHSNLNSELESLDLTSTDSDSGISSDEEEVQEQVSKTKSSSSLSSKLLIGSLMLLSLDKAYTQDLQRYFCLQQASIETSNAGLQYRPAICFSAIDNAYTIYLATSSGANTVSHPLSPITSASCPKALANTNSSLIIQDLYNGNKSSTTILVGDMNQIVSILGCKLTVDPTSKLNGVRFISIVNNQPSNFSATYGAVINSDSDFYNTYYGADNIFPSVITRLINNLKASTNTNTTFPAYSIEKPIFTEISYISCIAQTNFINSTTLSQRPAICIRATDNYRCFYSIFGSWISSDTFYPNHLTTHICSNLDAESDLKYYLPSSGSNPNATFILGDMNEIISTFGCHANGSLFGPGNIVSLVNNKVVRATSVATQIFYDDYAYTPDGNSNIMLVDQLAKNIDSRYNPGAYTTTPVPTTTTTACPTVTCPATQAACPACPTQSMTNCSTFSSTSNLLPTTTAEALNITCPTLEQLKSSCVNLFNSTVSVNSASSIIQESAKVSALVGAASTLYYLANSDFQLSELVNSLKSCVVSVFKKSEK